MAKASLAERMNAKIAVKEASLMSKTAFFEDRDYVTLDVPFINVAFSGRLKGGLTAGVTIIAGESKTYKTLLMLLSLKAHQKKYPDGFALLYDTENGITPEYLALMEIDMDRVMHIPVDDIEQMKIDIVNRLNEVDKGDRLMICVDSLGMIASRKEIEDAEEGKVVADMTRAKASKSFFRLITAKITKKELYFVGIQHTYMEIGMYPKAIVGGGTGQIYAANTILIISKAQVKEKVEGKDALVGFKFTLNVVKSRYVKEGSKIPFEAHFESGLYRWSGLFDLAKEAGFVENVSKGWWTTVDPETGEVADKKLRESEIKSDDAFFESLIANPKFNEFVENKFLLGTPVQETFEDDEDDE